MVASLFVFHRSLGPGLFTRFRQSCAIFWAPIAPSQITATVLAVGLLLTEIASAPAQQSAQLKDGRVVQGRLLGDSPAQLRFRGDKNDGRLSPLTIRSIETAAPAEQPVVRGAVRRIKLASGDSFMGEIVKWSPEAVEVRLAGQEQLGGIPAAAIAAIFQPQGTVNLLYEDFEDEALQWPQAAAARRDDLHHLSGKFSLVVAGDAPPLDYDLPAPISAGQVSLSFRDDSPADADSRWDIEFRFETQLGERVLRVEVGAGREFFDVTAPLGPRFSRQPLRRRTGWHDLLIRFDALDTMILLDKAVLAAGPSMKGVWKSVRLVPRTTTTRAQLRIDDVRITQFVAAEKERLPVPMQDVLWMASGDEIYGTITGIDSTEVRMHGKFGDATVPWSELRGVLFREREAALPPVAGLLARITLRPTSISRQTPPEWVIAAVTSSDSESVTLSHPALGEQTWPWSRVQKIEPLFTGQYRLLFPGVRHLGDEVRGQFRRPQPDGRQLTVAFPLDELPEKGVAVSLSVAEMEPAGSRTPPGHPYLDDLKAGHLSTDLSINGHSLGTVNQRIHLRADVDKPDRIRVSVPRELLTVGENVLEFRQRPAKPSSTGVEDFDDCEISHIALEIEASAQP